MCESGAIIGTSARARSYDGSSVGLSQTGRVVPVSFSGAWSPAIASGHSAARRRCSG